MMRSLQMVFLIFLSMFVKGQNIVPNGSFEKYHLCPPALAGGGQSIALWCDDWYTFGLGTSDYFNACNPLPDRSGVPYNIVGYQAAAQGVAYTGMLTYDASTPDKREYIATKIPAMYVGEVYEVSMSVSLAEYSHTASNGLGIFFFKDKHVDSNNAKVLQVVPQVSYDSYGPIKDTLVWTRLKMYYKPDSAYTRIIIGSFKNDISLTKTPLKPSGQYTYFYIDSIMVRIAKNRIVTNYADAKNLCPGDTIMVPFSVDTNAGSGNVFTVQLSRQVDGFKSPYIIGQKAGITSDTIKCVIPENIRQALDYRLRVVASKMQYDTVWDNRMDISINFSTPKIVTDTICCETTKLVLQSHAEVPADKYEWTGPSGFTHSGPDAIIEAITPFMSGRYFVKAQKNNCAIYDSADIKVVPISKLALASNSEVCEGDSLYILSGATVPDAIFNWAGPSAFISSISDLHFASSQINMSGLYKLVANNSGCITTDSINIKVKPAPAPLVSSNGPLAEGDNLALETANTLPHTSYLWKGPRGFRSDEKDPFVSSVNSSMAGVYILETNLDGCIDTASIYVDIKSEEDSFYFILYPNPNNGNFTIAGKVHQPQQILLKIFTAGGQHVYSEGFVSLKRNIKRHISMPAVASGHYMLYLRADGKKVAIPFTVIR